MAKCTKPATGRQYDLRYVSQLSPEELRARLEEQTLPYDPWGLRKKSLVLRHLEGGDFNLISPGGHHHVKSFGIALVHLEPRPSCRDTVLYVTWEKNLKEKRRPRDLLLIPLLLGILTAPHWLFGTGLRDSIQSYLGSAIVTLAIALFVHLISPDNRAEERKKLQTFIEQTLLE